MTEEDVRAHLDAAQPRRRRKAANGAAGAAAVLPVLFADRWAGRAPPPQGWIVPAYVPTRTVTILSGHGGVNKTTIALQLLVAGATGTAWLGMDCDRAPVLGVFAEEEAERDLHGRLAAICARLDIDMGELGELALADLTLADSQLIAEDDGNGQILATPLFEALRGHAKELSARLVIIDGAAAVFGGNENSRREVRQFMNMLRRLAIDIDGAVVLIAHPSRAGIRDDSGTSGSTDWHNAARSLLYLTAPAWEDDEDDEAPDPNLRELRLLKHQNAPARDPLRLRWEEGALIPVEGSWGAVARIEEGTAERMFLDALETLQAHGSGEWANNLRNSPRYAPKLLAPLADGRVRPRDFEGALARLLRSGAVKSIDKGGRKSMVVRAAAVPEPDLFGDSNTG